MDTIWPIYHFKILVPAAAAGRIIGKGGTTIAQLQKDAGARVKMSKASEFYPGTTERVCLISGPIEGILKINDFFMENFSSTSIKILVPNSTAGMIIGRGGSYIKQIKEESGAYVQISQKCTDLSLPERCVTIVGELENIRKACAMILCKIVEDAGTASSSCSINNLSSTTSSSSSSITTATTTITPSSIATTSSIQSTQQITNNNNNNIINNNNNNNLNGSSGGIISTSTTTCGGLVAPLTSQSQPITTLVNTNTSNSCGLVASSSAAAAAAAAAAAVTSVSSDMNSAQIIESIKLVLRVSGYGEDAVSEITSAMSTLASYGVLGVGLGLL